MTTRSPHCARQLQRLCRLIETDHEAASQLAQQYFPFAPLTRLPLELYRPAGLPARRTIGQSAKRKLTDSQKTLIWIRDGFLDRYTGEPLVFPGALYAIGGLLPEAIPRPDNQTIQTAHLVYWTLFPAVDHVVALADGGAQHEDNYATVSFIRNTAKGTYSREELGWALLPRVVNSEWDGLCTWFVKAVEKHPELLEYNRLGNWLRHLRNARSIFQATYGRDFVET